MKNPPETIPSNDPPPGWALGIRPIEDDDHEDVHEFLVDHWGSHNIVSLGRVHDASRLPGFVAPSTIGDLSGLITLHLEGDSLEIVTMNSIHRGRGIGTSLMARAEHFARENGATRLWLVATNDNVDAMLFYQRRGFRMVKVHRDAVSEARKVKPQIPEIGESGVPILDLVEFEKPVE